MTCIEHHNPRPGSPESPRRFRSHRSHRRPAIFTPHRKPLLKAVIALCLVFTTLPALPYSVQSHEQLIDLAWKQSIRPLLLRRFPNLTPAQLEEAHAYAYGGCAIQDFGYYPFGNAYFSDLTHYVRSGDFVLALLTDAKTPDELAFAIGSLSHYIGDNFGHSIATNRSVPVEFPGLEKRYGPVVNYAEDPDAHVQTEFAFDINQLSKGRFAPSAYLKHVGLKVPDQLLRRAFFETYGLDLPKIIGKRDAALHIYQFAVRRFLPDIARAETILHKKNFPQDTPGPELTLIVADLHQASIDNDWEAWRKPPGFSSHLFAGFIFILPKVGPLRMLAIKGPNDRTEQLYIRSLNRSIKAMRFVLANDDHIGRYVSNRDLDTGAPVRPGSYSLTDKTYARLLADVTRHPHNVVPTQLKHDLAAYYANPDAPILTKNNPRQWAAVQADLTILASMKTIGPLDPIPDQSFYEEQDSSPTTNSTSPNPTEPTDQ